MTRPFAAPAMLFCPGDRPDRFDKALQRADSIILDLEDAVAPTSKATAREHVMAALFRLPRERVHVRINAPGSPWYFDDVAALSAYPEVAVVLPMAGRGAEVRNLAPHPVICLCETAAGIRAAFELASEPGCIALMWGSEDLTASLHGRSSRPSSCRLSPVMTHARHEVLIAARAAGKDAIDSVFVGVSDDAALRLEASEAADMGFAGKACIHPDQVAAIRTAFRPGAEAIEQARAILLAGTGTAGVFRYRDMMVDAPVLAQARQVLAAVGELPKQTSQGVIGDNESK